MSPLRSKILVPEEGTRSAVCRFFSLSRTHDAQVADRVSLQSSLSSSAEIWKPLPDDEPEDVVFASLYGLRTIELNRPVKLNPLNGSMIRKIAPRLIEWQKSDMANVVVMKGAGKALCAGGDVATLAERIKSDGEEGSQWADDYFALEYKLDHLIATYKKPYISFMDGFTMGGGVGLSIHAPFRIATERTVFAMPETTIGFFPDVGASFFLSRMPGAVGLYLAMTSERLKGVNVLYSGIATHYLHSTTLSLLETRLSELRFRDFDSMEKRLYLVNQAIEQYSTGLPYDEPMQIAGDVREAIDRCFSKLSVKEILQALDEELSGPSGPWARKTLDTLAARSPTSLCVTFEQMKQGQNWSIADAFKREHQIAAKFMRHPDFVEGVDAQVIRKDYQPQWQPASLKDIANPQEHAAPFFEISAETAPLELLTDDDYDGYPHWRLGLPTEQEVMKLVKSKQYSAKQVVKLFELQREGKQGVREVVSDILVRKTREVKVEKRKEFIVQWVGGE